jgi:hypothetical protein
MLYHHVFVELSSSKNFPEKRFKRVSHIAIWKAVPLHTPRLLHDDSPRHRGMNRTMVRKGSGGIESCRSRATRRYTTCVPNSSIACRSVSHAVVVAPCYSRHSWDRQAGRTERHIVHCYSVGSTSTATSVSILISGIRFASPERYKHSGGHNECKSGYSLLHSSFL